MVIGLGLDLAEVQFWREALDNPATAVVQGTFTPAERAYARDGLAGQAAHLAARFAAKEAFIKALGGARRPQAPLVSQLDLRSIEVSRDDYGRPSLTLHGEARRLADLLGVRHVQLSLTHTDTTAGAVVVLEA
jgi:holo-[acyl-carrier protein] synthase